MSSFVHLHNHSHYSLLDGACKIGDLVERAVNYNMPAIALTDHGNMFGHLEFYLQAVKKGIKPIIGVEAYIAPRSRKEKQKSEKKDHSYHIILLAKNRTGYKNLMKLVSIGFTEGFYYKPRIDLEVLRHYHEGLIALTACIKGEVPRAIIQGNLEAAREKAEQYRDIFGDDFYLEIQDHGIPEEKVAAEGMKYLSETLSIPIVATNDIHYLNREHYESHDILLCIQTSKDIDDPSRLKYSTQTLYFKNEEEMRELFPDNPDVIDRTMEVAEKCNLELDFDKTYLPKYDIPPESSATNLEEYLREIAWQGLQERYPEITPEIEERFNYELGVINQMGYPGYFLIVKDFIDYARSKGIPVGPGRGSAAGSLISYACGITNIDPLRYNLIFERFLNPDRVSLPDIDIDFCFERREEVIAYVRKKYGEQNVSQIITFGTMAARGVIRDVGRVLNMKYGDVDKIAKAIPAGMNIDKAYEDVKEFREIFKTDDEQYRKLLKHARVLEGLARHASTHAAGVVIAPEELTNFVPLYKSNTGDISTQLDMNGVEKIGLLKMDFLGLRTLTVIENTLKMLKRRQIKIDLDKLPLDDEKTYELFGNGETIGVFQFESGGMQEYLKKLKPKRIEDMIAMNALYRPGPMKMIDDFIDRKFGRKKIEYPHPLLEPVLKETYGIIVYQEQVMQIASELAGFSLGQADLLRRAIGKKKLDIMKKMKIEFIQGAQAKGVDKKIAVDVFDLIEKFARYGFNKSHAAGYSVVAYQTAYLKAHYPAEFIAASLSSEMGNSDRIMVLLDECKRMKIEILPPDVNQSYTDFTVKGNSIRFGLGAVKNVGRGAIRSIIEARRKNGPFKNVFEMMKNVDLRVVNKKVLESLARAGALDSINKNRAQLYRGVETIINFAQSHQSERQKGQFSIFDTPVGKKEPERFSQYPALPDVEPWSDFEKLRNERELLGIYVTGHPLAKYKDEIRAFTTIKLNNLRALKDESAVKAGGIITNIKTIYDHSKRKMAFVTLEDFSGSAEALVFASVYEKYQPLIENDALIFIIGKVSSQEDKEPKIICDEILPLSEMKLKYTKNICVNLAIDDIKIGQLNELKKMVTAGAGKCGLLFHVTNGGKREYVIRSKKYRVAPTEHLLHGMKELVGEDNVWIEG